MSFTFFVLWVACRSVWHQRACVVQQPKLRTIFVAMLLDTSILLTLIFIVEGNVCRKCACEALNSWNSSANQHSQADLMNAYNHCILKVQPFHSCSPSDDIHSLECKKTDKDFPPDPPSSLGPPDPPALDLPDISVA
ncbi:hypothetical protein DM01DRAFT_303473 [Hesseltinella vesiculosa]|uniref:Uncharacterized protein n=1 Tax=Hesseltinella vesiculosa TaxID=101127 RepID=A0A1X2GYJ4_9FUNG|nr:hypothetical protein DM01DRAFT_303473 [Hesseltinella vesiculosa]